jgi:hypothetical protein
LNALNSVSVTGYSRSTTGAPVPGASSGLSGVARIRGAELESPLCQTVPIPRYALAISTRASTRGLRWSTNGTNSAHATSVSAQLR